MAKLSKFHYGIDGKMINCADDFSYPDPNLFISPVSWLEAPTKAKCPAGSTWDSEGFRGIHGGVHLFFFGEQEFHGM